MVAAKMLELQRERVIGLLGVSASRRRSPGRGLVPGLAAVPNRVVLGLVMRALGTRPPERAIRASLAAGLPEPVVDELVNGFVPESQRHHWDSVGEAVFSSRTA